MPEEKILCIVCGSPSAMFQKLENGGRARLAKSLTRVTGRKSEALYVHTDPCLPALVNNWAKYVAEGVGKTGLQKLGEEVQENVPTGQTDIQNP